MNHASHRPDIADWNGEVVRPGETRNLHLDVGESYIGMRVRIPIQVRRAEQDGPTVLITAALHGDELNGTGAIRQLMFDTQLHLQRGNLILVPVLNVLAFDRHSRYLPDRRDLNRCFPGRLSGSLASRMARQIFDHIVRRSDYGIDLHTATVRRTNYPNVRGDMSHSGVATLAHAFGTELIVDGKGPENSLRREATRAGCPTIVLEGGEVWKVEPGIVAVACRGITNVLQKLGMVAGKPLEPAKRLVLKKTAWLRAERGGFLQFHIAPGDVVDANQPLATNFSLHGEEQNVIYAPFPGVIVGMTTLPAVAPGEAICNIGRLPEGLHPSRLSHLRAQGDGMAERLVEELATNIIVTEKETPEP